jgi:hypothetical protein
MMDGCCGGRPVKAAEREISPALRSWRNGLQRARSTRRSLQSGWAADNSATGCTLRALPPLTTILRPLARRARERNHHIPRSLFNQPNLAFE